MTLSINLNRLMMFICRINCTLMRLNYFPSLFLQSNIYYDFGRLLKKIRLTVHGKIDGYG